MRDRWARRRVQAAVPIGATPYRGDIDGLRAISVAAVILFHIAPTRFPTGGIGVDIFFVISGYLIGGIVIDSVGRDRFSFAGFYLRRARRIAPAFLLMVIASSAAATVLLDGQPSPARLVR